MHAVMEITMLNEMIVAIESYQSCLKCKYTNSMQVTITIEPN